MSKYIFVTGGVVSSVGKGITAASVGQLLGSRGLSVSVQKLDPYLNVDPGTMSPYQHGEVFVTIDGAETDLDLGHYERFINIELSRESSVTAGDVYRSVLANERRGDYLGGTIQVVPHVTNMIKDRIKAVSAQSEADIILIEVGGTVGDIEGLPFLEAIRQIRNELGREDALFIHVTFLPFIEATAELKTKPTQHSVRELGRSAGIQPDIIVARADHHITDEIISKLALFGDVEENAVIPLETVDSIYKVPLVLEEAGLGNYIMEKLGFEKEIIPDLTNWRNLVNKIEQPKKSISIALVGKYVDLHDAYLSVKEALHHAGLEIGVDIHIDWISAEEIENAGSAEELLSKAQGIIVPGGFGPRGIEGMIEAARYARENEIPYLGLCLGMQIMVIEHARNVLNYANAHSTEFDSDSPFPVITIMQDQQDIDNKGGTMRLGNYSCQLVPGTLAASAYDDSVVQERHRHRFEFNNKYKRVFEESGLIASGMHSELDLVEICEIKDHKFMVGTQFHPEFRSRPVNPHPLFKEFIATATKVLLEEEQTPG